MGYIPNTPEDRKAMLSAMGYSSFEELLRSAVPDELLCQRSPKLPEPLSEMEGLAEAWALSATNADSASFISFLGAGAYDHYIPAAVGHITSRPEFATAYTPYQAEVSQGTLQAIFEFQSLIARLTGMDVANASMYDGPTALAEAVLMAVGEKRRERILVPEHLHPHYLKVLKTYTHPTGIELITVPARGGVTDYGKLAEMADDTIAAGVIQNPNFAGCIEDGFAFAEAIEKSGAELLAVADPISLGMLTPPGEYGADIALGEAQPLGNSVGFGGPYIGFFGAREKHVRKMPGRLIGASTDDKGTRGFVMTLQTREQHIRREKATSNICTNEALCALSATVYLSLMGEGGFKEIASQCYHKAHYLADKLAEIDGVEMVYDDPFFREFAVRLSMPAREFVEAMAANGFLAGVPMQRFYPEKENELLIAVTEKRSKTEMDDFAEVTAEVLNA